MRFLVDAQLPPSLATLLKAHGHQAEHVDDVGLRSAGDATIWRYAVQHDAVIVTKDEDFQHRLQQGGLVLVVVWLRVGNTSRRALLEWFEPLLPKIETLLAQGDHLIELR